MDEHATNESNAPAKRHRLRTIFLASVAGIAGLAAAHHDGARMLAAGGHVDSAKLVAHVVGVDQKGLQADLSRAVTAEDRAAVASLMQVGAEPTDKALAAIITKPEILDAVLDAVPSLADRFTRTATDGNGSTEALEVLATHGVQFDHHDLFDAANNAPGLVPWLLQHRTYDRTSIAIARNISLVHEHWDNFERLRALSEPTDAEKLEFLKIDNASAVKYLLEKFPYSEDSLRDALKTALERDWERSFYVIKSHLPAATVKSVVADYISHKTDREGLLMREMAGIPPPATLLLQP
jgi:hypothetical protein